MTWIPFSWTLKGYLKNETVMLLLGLFSLDKNKGYSKDKFKDCNKDTVHLKWILLLKLQQ